MVKILLVEDDTFISRLYAERLKKEGFEVETADCGEKAIEKITQSPPHLLILDLVLPDIDGWRVLERINELKMKREDLKKMEVFVLSNLRGKEVIERATSLGVRNFFVKAQSTPNTIIQEIKRILK